MKQFDKIQIKTPRSNKFDLSHDRKFSLNMGALVPILLQEVLPGDSWQCKTEIMMRFAPMLAPIMHRVDCTIHYFFVPNRIVWDEWEDFITGGEDGLAAPVSPYIYIGGANDGHGLQATGNLELNGLADYFGLPVNYGSLISTSSEVAINALPFRGYQLIYNEYYRDQNLQPKIAFGKGSGRITSDPEINDLAFLRYRAWEKDYFTSALPWAQRGPSVYIPIEGEADWAYKLPTVATRSLPPLPPGPAAGNTQLSASAHLQDSGGNDITLQNIDHITLTNATTTINDLRNAVRLQEFLEKNARGGARYTEQLRSHFGVKSSDARLQRPEYVGGYKVPCVISEVLSSFQDPAGAGNPQGNMSGHGIAVGGGNRIRRFFEEHGFLFGIMSVMPRTAYQDGIHKMWNRGTKLDYAFPEFAQLGEQEVKNYELYYGPVDGVTNFETFGYQSRYAEYKYMNSSVHGDLRDSLDYWHMGRKFSTRPGLNADFVVSDPTERIFAVEDPATTKLYCQIHHQLSALRRLPYFGTPTL